MLHMTYQIKDVVARNKNQRFYNIEMFSLKDINENMRKFTVPLAPKLGHEFFEKNTEYWVSRIADRKT